MAMSGPSVSFFFRFLSETGMSHILDYQVLWSILTHRAFWNTDAAIFPKLLLEAHQVITLGSRTSGELTDDKVLNVRYTPFSVVEEPALPLCCMKTRGCHLGSRGQSH